MPVDFDMMEYLNVIIERFKAFKKNGTSISSLAGSGAAEAQLQVVIAKFAAPSSLKRPTYNCKPTLPFNTLTPIPNCSISYLLRVLLNPHQPLSRSRMYLTKRNKISTTILHRQIARQPTMSSEALTFGS